MSDRPAEIKERALALGFDTVGITSADIGQQPGERLTTYTHGGLHGDMSWLAGTAERRRHPQALWPQVRSIIVVGQNYGSTGDPLSNLGQHDRGNISIYARGRDYHVILKKRLKKLARWAAETYECDVKIFVDTAPVMEKPIAAQAGIGWAGKHTNLVSRRFGSWLFLGSVFTTLELDSDSFHEDRCGSCRRCLDACPTDAFPEPYMLDARRCISYLTIEHKGHIAPEFRKAIGNRIYGCDDCLAVCPWNKFAEQAREANLFARAESIAPRLGDLLSLDEAAFRQIFAGSPIKRTSRNRFLRNVLIAAGNSRDSRLAAVVQKHLRDSSPLVRAMAVWALAQILENGAFAALRSKCLGHETDAAVEAEWLTARAEVGKRPIMKTYYEHGFGNIESWPIDPREDLLVALMTDLFENHWSEIAFGPLIQGSTWEVRLDQPPRRLSMLDGYLTVDVGSWHFHICLGEHRGGTGSPVDADLAQHRRTARAEFIRRVNDDGTPDVWGIRLYNGKGEQQITILLPSPFKTPEMKVAAEPDWSRLRTWDTLRERYLGLDPDQRDRSGRRLIHG